MKTITINVSEPVYAALRAASKAAGRPMSDLIREAMEIYRTERLHPKGNLVDFRPRSTGRILSILGTSDDLLDEMLG